MDKKLYVVGIGPNGKELMTLNAVNILKECEYIVGYSKYIDRIKDDFEGIEFISTSMRTERERALKAFELAEKGLKVALISSGDSGIYGMACLAFEIVEKFSDVELKIIPGITIANSAASLLGSPLTLDFAVISLSDILVEWATIEKRLNNFAESGVTTIIYNPKSINRDWQLEKAFNIFKRYRKEFFVCVVKNGFMDNQEIIITNSCSNDWIKNVDMMSVVYFCDENAVKINNKIVVPRGYDK